MEVWKAITCFVVDSPAGTGNCLSGFFDGPGTNSSVKWHRVRELVRAFPLFSIFGGVFWRGMEWSNQRGMRVGTPALPCEG